MEVEEIDGGAVVHWACDGESMWFAVAVVVDAGRGHEVVVARGTGNRPIQTAVLLPRGGFSDDWTWEGAALLEGPSPWPRLSPLVVAGRLAELHRGARWPGRVGPLVRPAAPRLSTSPEGWMVAGRPSRSAPRAVARPGRPGWFR